MVGGKGGGGGGVRESWRVVAEGVGSVDGGSAKWGRGRVLVRRGRKGALA